MKYLVLIPDGMADRPSEKLGGKTPMQIANKPTMDALASKSLCGTVLNVPAEMVPESDTANLAIMSYDPRQYSKGRSPLEAVSLGIKLAPDDTAIRCNLVTISEDEENYEDRVMIDHSSDEISTAEADELVKALNKALPMEGRHLFTGVSYRHCLIWKNASTTYDFSRPHDIIGRRIGEYLPKEDNGGAEFLEFMKKGYEVLKDHPVNKARRAAGKRPANSPWLWSPGAAPSLPSFKEKWGLDATVVSAVDLIKGIGICAGFDVPDIEGATGTLDTNYAGKLQAAKDAINAGRDFVYIHLEGPDECGHHGDIPGKVVSLERIDEKIASPMLAFLKERGEDFAIMVLPDHPTPIATKTHASDAIPFVLYRSDMELEGHADAYSEKSAERTGIFMPSGEALMKRFLGMEK